MVFIQWDNSKSALNFKKHGVSFDEAASVLFAPNALELFDDKHSALEDRFWIIGESELGRTLLVVYTFRRSRYGKEIYRIISARVANSKERKATSSKS